MQSKPHAVNHQSHSYDDILYFSSLLCAMFDFSFIWLFVWIVHEWWCDPIWCHTLAIAYCLLLICLLCWWLWLFRLDTAVVDIGPPADWVKINVQKTVSSFIMCWTKDNLCMLSTHQIAILHVERLFWGLCISSWPSARRGNWDILFLCYLYLTFPFLWLGWHTMKKEWNGKLN